MKKGPIGKIRLIGGQWKGRKLSVLNIKDVRPTTNMIRETLFNWLAPYIQKSKCLDCFAGSGALGIEAISRYAESVTLLELNRTVAQQIRYHLQMLHAYQGIVIQTDTLKWLQGPGKPFNIVFVDPPFHKELLKDTLKLLEQRNWLSYEALIYIENKAKRNIPFIPTNWKKRYEKTAGQVSYCLYQRKSGAL